MGPRGGSFAQNSVPSPTPAPPRPFLRDRPGVGLQQSEGANQETRGPGPQQAEAAAGSEAEALGVPRPDPAVGGREGGAPRDTQRAVFRTGSGSLRNIAPGHVTAVLEEQGGSMGQWGHRKRSTRERQSLLTPWGEAEDANLEHGQYLLHRNVSHGSVRDRGDTCVHGGGGGHTGTEPQHAVVMKSTSLKPTQPGAAQHASATRRRTAEACWTRGPCVASGARCWGTQGARSTLARLSFWAMPLETGGDGACDPVTAASMAADTGRLTGSHVLLAPQQSNAWRNPGPRVRSATAVTEKAPSRARLASPPWLRRGANLQPLNVDVAGGAASDREVA